MNSSVLKWPDKQTVMQSVQSWTAAQIRQRPDIVRLGYFGSYARNDWGVGSDLDLIAIIEDTGEPFEFRARHWDLNNLPVPAEIIVYTLSEWRALARKDSRFFRMLEREAVWVCTRKPKDGFTA